MGGARVGLLAAAIAAVYPVLIGADASLLTESLFGLCVAVAMLVAYRLLDRPSAGWALALGVVIRVASLARSEGLPSRPFWPSPSCGAGARPPGSLRRVRPPWPA